MKLHCISGRLWWVPDEHSTSLAVQIDDVGDYEGAIHDKLTSLIERSGTLTAVELTVAWVMQMRGVRIDLGGDAGHLAFQCLATCDIGERVREGSPHMARPASFADAKEAVEAQSDLTVEDFLG